MSVETIQFKLDPRDEYRETIRKRRLRRRLLHTGGLWGGFALMILLTVLAFLGVAGAIEHIH
jgi:uncharacterized iron-regulated membrane protein